MEPHAGGVIDADISDMPASGQCLEVANSSSPPVGRWPDDRITGKFNLLGYSMARDRANIDGRNASEEENEEPIRVDQKNRYVVEVRPRVRIRLAPS